MMMFQTSRIREGLAFGESPRWRDGRLWFSEFYRHGVFTVAQDGSDERMVYEVPGQPSGLDWLPDGDQLCVSMTDHLVLRVGPSGTSVHADLSDYCGFWANDLATGATGVAYVGNFGFDLDDVLARVGIEGLLASPPPTTNLVVLGPNGSVRQVIPDMAFPNGTVLTPDGATLIVAETMAARLTAFSVADDGTLHDRRVWAELEFAAPDGICLDAAGQVWFANAISQTCQRVREGGEVTATATTTQTAFACALGGDDGSTLFVMSAPTSSRFRVANARLGAIESVRVDVPGA